MIEIILIYFILIEVKIYLLYFIMKYLIIKMYQHPPYSVSE